MISNQIDNLNPNYAEKVKFLYMDARKMEFEDEVFNVVFDKGTLDSILVLFG
jgi:ubiquinone/menaquinone biosynthesis C-methylase UbiE